MRDRLKLNLGAGGDVRAGWLNVDTDLGFLDAGPERVCHSMVALPFVADEQADLVLINHALHQLSWADADLTLAEAERVLCPGGRLVIVEADVYGVLGDLTGTLVEVSQIVPEQVEPTYEGRLLRWASWYGERRSLWGAEMLCERLRRLGLDASDYDPWAFDEFVGNRAAESFLVIADK